MQLNRINNSCKNANRPIQRKITFVGTNTSADNPATTPTAPIQTTTYQWNKGCDTLNFAKLLSTKYF
jgi:hypothetical protein